MVRWFGHVEHKSGDDWVSVCRNVVVAGVKCAGRGRKTSRECVKDYTFRLGLHPECTADICGEASYRGKRLTLAVRTWKK